MTVLTAPVTEFASETPRGVFTLRPVCVADDLRLVHRWMHQPHVVPYWRQDWPAPRLAGYLADQLDGVVSRPCLGLLAGVPVSYWEIYRPFADPVGEAYDAAPDDLGVHLLIGGLALTGRGLGTMLLDAVASSLLRLNPSCRRIVAEPDVGNTASVKAFARAGFERVADVGLPDKTAALMVRTR